MAVGALSPEHPWSHQYKFYSLHYNIYVDILSPVGLVRVTPLSNRHVGRLVGDLLEDFVDALSPDVRVCALSPSNWLSLIVVKFVLLFLCISVV